MSVKITELCIKCGSCIDECPTESILDDYDNPNKEECFYVIQDKCTECFGLNDAPICAQNCPIDGSIVWGTLKENQSPIRKNKHENELIYE